MTGWETGRPGRRFRSNPDPEISFFATGIEGQKSYVLYMKILALFLVIPVLIVAGFEAIRALPIIPEVKLLLWVSLLAMAVLLPAPFIERSLSHLLPEDPEMPFDSEEKSAGR